MRWRRLLFVAFLCAGATDAWAIIGRPLTPLSYAGVARRTTRRAVYAGAAATGAVVGGAAYAGAAALTALPGGCIRTGPYYSCGGVNYQPAYNGPDVVYVEVNKD